MTRFWLARHGETDWNLEGRFQGQADPPLNAKGLEQAHTLADRLVGESIAAIYCSDLQRARRTAQIIGKRLRLKPKVDKRLREISLGAWEGMQKEQIQSVYSELWQRRKLDPLNVPAPGGENLLELAERVEQAVNQNRGGKRECHGFARFAWRQSGLPDLPHPGFAFDPGLASCPR